MALCLYLQVNVKTWARANVDCDHRGLDMPISIGTVQHSGSLQGS